MFSEALVSYHNTTRQQNSEDLDFNLYTSQSDLVEVLIVWGRHGNDTCIHILKWTQWRIEGVFLFTVQCLLRLHCHLSLCMRAQVSARAYTVPYYGYCSPCCIFLNFELIVIPDNFPIFGHLLPDVNVTSVGECPVNSSSLLSLLTPTSPFPQFSSNACHLLMIHVPVMTDVLAPWIRVYTSHMSINN